MGEQGPHRLELLLALCLASQDKGCRADPSQVQSLPRPSAWRCPQAHLQGQRGSKRPQVGKAWHLPQAAGGPAGPWYPRAGQDRLPTLLPWTQVPRDKHHCVVRTAESPNSAAQANRRQGRLTTSGNKMQTTSSNQDER